MKFELQNRDCSVEHSDLARSWICFWIKLSWANFCKQSFNFRFDYHRSLYLWIRFEI